MSKIPLFLKIKENQQVEGFPLFEVVSDKTIKFNEKNYDFSKIFSKDDYNELIEEPSTDSSCFIFMGPTGAGKTTTLRKVIYNKIRALQDSKSVTFLTAFEVNGNRHIIDLLERKSNNRKEIQNAISIEARLKKEKLNQDNAASIISAVFSRRNTRKTSFNDESSRSCLIITFFYNNKRVTYIDLMGNEKFDKSTPTSNIFANSSMSSITQLLSKRIGNGRSSNFITNLIFRKDTSQHKNINIILHLDQYGDCSLVKSALTNIADLLKNFDFDNNLVSKKSYSSHVPNYAKPTVASLSPSKLGLRPSNRINTSPSKVKSVVSTVRNIRAPKSPLKQNVLKSPLISAYLRSSPVKLQSSSDDNTAIENRGNLINDFHGIQVAGLKKSIEDLEYENSQLKKEHEEILEFFNKNSTEVNTDLTIYKESEDFDVIAMKAELEDLRKMNYETESLEQQKKFLIDKVDEFKIDFHRFKEEHGSFKEKVDNLKQTIIVLENTASSLEKANIAKDEHIKQYSLEKDEVTKKNNELELIIEESSAKMESLKGEVTKKNSELELIIEESSAKMESLKGELSKIITSNKELMENHDSLKQKYTDLQNISKENEVRMESIALLNKQLEEKSSLIRELEEKVNTNVEALSQLSIEVEEKRKHLKKLENDIHEKDNEIHEKDNEMHKKDNEIQNLKTEIQEKEDIIKDIKEEIENFNSAKTSENSLIEDKNIELDNANKKINSLQTEAESAKEVSAKLTESLKLSEQQLLELSNTINGLKNDISLSESKNSGLLSQIEEQSSNITSYIDTNNELKQKVDKLETKNSNLKDSLSDLKKEFEKKESKWTKKLEKLEKKQTSETSDLETKNSAQTHTINELEKELKNKDIEWSQKLEDFKIQNKTEITNLELNNKSLEEKLNKLNNEMEIKEKEWTKKLEDLENSKNDQINKLQTQLSNNISIEPVQLIEPIQSTDLFNDQISFPKFNPSDIYEDINSNIVDLPSESIPNSEVTSKESTPVEAIPKEKSPSKKKKVLMPSNKIENYKDKINSMSKDKKLKRKASSQKMKHKHHKSNTSKSQTA